MNRQIPKLSKHAAIRSQQRGIPIKAIDVLLDFGKLQHSKGGLSFSMDKSSRYKAQAELGEVEYKLIERWLNCYVVVSQDGKMLTVAFRTRRARLD